MVHLLGGMFLLIVAVLVFGSLLGKEAARSWDILRPGTRPTRKQAVAWGTSHARSAARSGVSWGRARLVRSRVAGWMPARVRGIVLRPPGEASASDGDGDSPHGSDGDPQLAGEAAPGESPRGGTPGPQATDGGTTPPPGAKVVQGNVVTDDEPAGNEKPAEGDDGTSPPPSAPESPAEPQYPTGRNPEMTTPASAVPGAEEMAAGMARLRAWAVAGNMEKKEAAFAALAEVWAQDSSTVDALGKSMQDDDKYGPEITEPVAAMAKSLTALSTRSAELEGTIAGRLAMSGREQIRSGYQAPERHQMQEAGGR